MSASVKRRTAVVVGAVISAVAVVISGTAETPAPVREPVARTAVQMSGTYVALGSSYASGPDVVTDRLDGCLRTRDNYPNQVAEAMRLRLVDASCSASTTENIVAVPQRFIHPPQIDAITPDTSLVTITSGGNDVGYIARLLAMSCGDVIGHAVPALNRVMRNCTGRPVPPEPTPTAYDRVRHGLVESVRAIRTRAPRAKVMIVDYPPVTVAGEPLCARLPLTQAEAAETIRIFDALATATAQAARETGATLVRASTAGAMHTVCSADPWLRGFAPPIPYHPDGRGKAGVAALVVEALGGPTR